MLLLNRVNISKKNLKTFSDDKGIFVYYSTEKIIKDVRCCKNTVKSLMNNLENAGLIHKEYQANGLPIKIYVNDIRNGETKCHTNETRSPPKTTTDNSHIEKSEENKKKMRQNFGTKKIKRRTI